MDSDLAHIEFYFPKSIENINSKDELADAIVSMVRERGSMEYVGYLDEKSLRQGITKHLGDANIADYKNLDKSEKEVIEKTIKETVLRCNKVLPVPTKIFIFVLPYLPTKKDRVFRGVMGLACYSCVFHIFVSPDEWTSAALIDTVAHELNHTIYYYYHYNDFGNYTLLDEMILEGFAENFKEHTIHTPPSAWATAMDKESAYSALQSMSDILFSKDPGVIQGVLFGCDRYKRWTGYSVGYWIIKNFIEKNKHLSWKEMMKIDSQSILNSITKK